MNVPFNETRVAVCGLGQMGASAAVCFSRAGFPVLLWGRDRAKLDAAPDTLTVLNAFLDETLGPVAQRPGEVTLTNDLTIVNSSADFVLECIAEDLPQKIEFFKRLQSAADRGGVLASCTSGLSVTAIGRGAAVGRRLVGAHFWNPSHLMPVVEVVRGDETDPGLETRTADLLSAAGKIPVHCKDVPGFIGNRLFHALFREAMHLVQTGVCTAADVDKVARLTFGLRLPAVGPLENADLVGLNLVAQIQSYLLADLCDARDTMPIVDSLRSAGKTGMSVGAGFHEWTVGQSQAVIDARNRQIVNQLQFLKTIGRL